MDLNFFKQTRVLDGGIGQELLPTGTKPVAVVVESPNGGSGPLGTGFDMARIINIQQSFCVIDRYNEESGTQSITLRVYYSTT